METAPAQFDAQFHTGVFVAAAGPPGGQSVAGRPPPGFTVLDLLSGKVPPTLSVLNEDSAAFYAQIDKTAATGTQFSLRSDVMYDKTNAFFGLTPAEYDAYFTAQVRQPLLQSAGIEFNRIAGPQAQPGVYNGVLLARLTPTSPWPTSRPGSSICCSRSSSATGNSISPTATWTTKIAARDAALGTWRVIQKKCEAGTADEEQEARAREQFYLFDAQVINATNGVASGNGPVLLQGGVYGNERRLRSLMGLPANDGRLIRPADEPTTAEAVFNWSDSIQQAFWRRVELRRQKWVIKRREMELTASKNFLDGRLDLLAQYRWRGWPDVLGTENSALDEVFRRPLPGLAARRAILHHRRQPAGPCRRPQRRADAVPGAGPAPRAGAGDPRRRQPRVRRSRSGLRHHASTCNRIQAAHRQLEEVRKKYDAGTVPVDFLLDAQQRVADADSLYHRSLVDYTLSLAKVNRARGTLLDYYDVSLAEGPWCDEAYVSAAKQARRFLPRVLDYTLTVPPPVSRGPYAQQVPAGPAAPMTTIHPPRRRWAIARRRSRRRCRWGSPNVPRSPREREWLPRIVPRSTSESPLGRA